MTDTVIDDPMLDEEWLAAPAKRSRLRAGLVLALAAAICFLGGAIVQKQFGAETAADSAAGPGGFAGGQLPEGLPEGLEGLPEGFPEGIGQPGFPAGDTGPGASDDTGGTTTDDASEAVIGEVVEVRGDVWIVEDLGGQRHEIKVGDTTDVVRETSIKPTQVKVGDPVDLTGTDSEGQLQADEVTLR